MRTISHTKINSTNGKTILYAIAYFSSSHSTYYQIALLPSLQTPYHLPSQPVSHHQLHTSLCSGNSNFCFLSCLVLFIYLPFSHKCVLCGQPSLTTYRFPKKKNGKDDALGWMYAIMSNISAADYIQTHTTLIIFL